MKRLLSILFAALLTINSTFVASPVLAEDDLSNEEIVETTNEEDTFEEQENIVLKCQELIDALPEEESINDENVYEIAEELLAIHELFEQLDDLQKEEISLEKYETTKSFVDSILVSISNNNNEEENVDEDEFYVPSSSFNYIDEADVPFVKHRKKKLFLDRGVDVLPSSYSLVNDKYVTSVKNQLGWGTCWSFAAMASAESNYLIENNKKSDELNIDLSELQVAWYGYTNYRVKDKLELITNDGIDILVDPGNDDKIISFGGNQQMASFILASEIGFSVESDVSYPTNYSDTETKENTNTYLSQFASEEKINELCYSSDYLVDQIDWYYMDESDTVKRALMERGALAVSYMHEVDEGHDSLQYCGADEMSYFYSASGGNNTNHAVTLVGWDDDYDKNKFSGKNGEKPTNNGAWILKNSWGTSFGDNGYFYISYEEASIKGRVAYGYSMMDKEGYDYDIYQYDGGAKFGCYEIDHSTKVIYGANVYTAKRNEKLEKVGIFTYNTDLKYEIKVYLNPTTSPVSGTLLTTKTGSLKNAGYSLIDIDDDVYIEEGKKYSVVVKYEELTDWISLPVDSSGHVINGDVQLNFNNSGENGQSYYSVNGVNYTDLWSRDGKTARIKALGIPYYDIEYVLDDGTNSANNPDRYIQNEIITFEDPTKDGYYFEGWYTDDDFDSEDKITSTEGYNEDLTLYAHWLPIINKIEFTIDDPVVGEYPDDSITAVVNDGDLLPDDVFENADSLKLVWKDHLSEEMNSYYWPGYPYLAFACVEINKSDYHLASNSDLVVKINGEIWTSQFDDDTSSYYKRRFGREFVTDDSTVDITSLEIDGISFPKAGTAYDKDLNDVVALVNGTKDDDIKVEYDWYDNETKTTPSVSFVDKQDYYLFVTVTIDKDTCEYYDLSSVPAVLKINEQNATQFGSLVDKSIQNDNGKCKQITFYKVVKCRQNSVIAFDDPNITDGMTVYIDGLPKTVHLVDGIMEVDIADTNVGIATTYVTSISTGISDGNEIHSKYPSSMNVYFLNKTSEGHVKAMKNDYYTDIMKYSGTAVRITGNRGLRFKTSINASKNAQLVNGNYEGYVAAEYGTMMCWKSDLQPGEEPVLVKQANGTYLPKYGGKASAFDRGQGIYRLFSMDSSKVVYTGVLVGEYTDSQCGDDFTYRTYLVLRPKDATDSSKDLIIYGGTMYRSISYVALQSKDDAAVKTKGTPEYEFVWKLIRATYGNAYDEPEE